MRPPGFRSECARPWQRTYVLGQGIEALASGLDGGWESTFNGRTQYPSLTDPSDGFVVFQAKFKERLYRWDCGRPTWLRP